MNVFPGWVPAARTGTQARVGVKQGYQPPAVMQPTGNYDAWDVIYNAPSNPFFDQPIQAHLRTPEQQCRPARGPDGYLPDGTAIWEKRFPGAPVLQGPNGGIVIPQPQLPRGFQGPAGAYGEIIPDGGTEIERIEEGGMTLTEATNEITRGALGTLGAVAVIAVLAYLGMKARS